MKYNPQKIEKKWQKQWEKEKLYEAKDFGHKNYMLLAEFPYTSGNLHMGHWFTYSIADIYGRYLRMNGYNVMYPIGFDAFGLPAENAAIKHGSTPEKWTKKNISNMTKQLHSIGAGFDWSRVVDTSDPEYYKWTQWIFLKLYEAGLAYRAKTFVNWCPHDKTVLANEQVIDGKCDRCGNIVEQRELSQWMFKITSFADVLIDDLEGLDWPETTKIAQKNWIGRSEGAKIKFPVKDQEHAVEVFTTRPDTIFGATFLVVSPELAKKWIEIGWKASQEVIEYISTSLRKTELQRQEESDKTGVFAGFNAVNPMTEKEIPIWVGDYVLGGYGTGALMAVPAHDQRDFEFAKKYTLPIKEVVLNEGDFIGKANESEGVLINSDGFDGMPSVEAREKITQALKDKGLGEFHKTYRLHDWILSRQRYWGAPIPMIQCSECGYQPVPVEDLPVKLPKLTDFLPVEGGKSPLARSEKWVKIKCPKCGGPAERETDTIDTFVDSSWYFMRYTDPKNEQELVSKEKMDKWLPVPLYIGGREHNTMHLLYARFITKALNSLGVIEFPEPFLSRRNHGVIMGPDGKRMSKSKGNVIDPDTEVDKYGADSVRMNFAFLGPFEQDYAWNSNNIGGVNRFLNRVWNILERFNDKQRTVKEAREIDVAISRAVKDVGNDIKQHKFNTGVSGLMKLVNSLEAEVGEGKLSKENTEKILKVIAPFAPHITEELWQEVLGNSDSVHLQSWPEYDEILLDQELITLVIQVNGKLRDTLQVKPGISEDEVKNLALVSDQVQRSLEGKEPKKFIYIQNKLLNIVI
ncbi:leucine--tRNA ligase [Candidatus Parcubacteria bacterium]|nr:leucine--tRNA ligase [Candidatus Parcubacteria bacterium]